MKKTIVAVLACILLFAFSVPVQAGEIQDNLSSRIDQVIEILKSSKKDGEKLDEALVVANEIFNWEVLTRYCMGRKWRSLTPEQKSELTEVFAEYLGMIYLERISGNTDDISIEYVSERMVTENKALVKTIVRSGQTEVSIDYRLYLKDGKWGVYDVVIEGISLVRSYRSQFTEFLNNKSIEDLIEELEQKIISFRTNRTTGRNPLGIIVIYGTAEEKLK